MSSRRSRKGPTRIGTIALGGDGVDYYEGGPYLLAIDTGGADSYRPVLPAQEKLCDYPIALAIDFAGASSGITHTHFGALKTKDAIVDQFRKHTGRRPSVDRDHPGLRISVHLVQNMATVSLDSSGPARHGGRSAARGHGALTRAHRAAGFGAGADRAAGRRGRI